jgi:hypothetical protein
VNALAQAITKTILATLPSNYVSEVVGPNYSLQIRTVAEELAKIQVMANEVYENTDFDFTRPEFLYQTLSSLVFPNKDGIPVLDGDVTTRQFMVNMVTLLLDGTKKTSVEAGLQLLADGTITVREVFTEPGSTLEEQFQFVAESVSVEGMTLGGMLPHTHGYSVDAQGNGVTTTISDPLVNVHVHTIRNWRIESEDGHAHYFIPKFPEDPTRYQDNASKIVRALKPSHALYQFRFLFQDVFRRIIRDANTYQLDDGVFSDELSWAMSQYQYEEARWYWEGAERIASTSGYIFPDRMTISDVTRSFRSVRSGAILKILTGSNPGTYVVGSILQLPFPNDPTARPYTTSGVPAGNAVVEGGIIRDVSTIPQDFGTLPEGATITFISGPNVGTYRLYAVAGNDGGPLGGSGLSGDRVIPDASLLRLRQRLGVGNETISYEVGVDTRGRSRPIDVDSEDVSSQFEI